MRRTFGDYARSFAENLDTRKAYRWAAGAFAGLALGLALETYRDPFVNLDPNSAVAPIVRDVFERGKKGEKSREKYYCLPYQVFGHDSNPKVEVQLDQYGHPTGGIRVTTILRECAGLDEDAPPFPMDRTLQEFDDLNGDGVFDGEDKSLDTSYERIVGGIKDNIRYRKMAEAVASYVERNGKCQTQWKPFFPHIPSLSFLGWNVPVPGSPALHFTLENGSKVDVRFVKDLDDIGEDQKLIYSDNLGIFVDQKIDYWDKGLLGRDRNNDTVNYRSLLEKVAKVVGIEGD